MGSGLCAVHRGRYQADDELVKSYIQAKQDGEKDEQLSGLHYRDSDYPLLHSVHCGQLLVPRGVGLELLPAFRLRCGREWSNLLFFPLPPLQFAATYFPDRESRDRESHIVILHLRRCGDVQSRARSCCKGFINLHH